MYKLFPVEHAIRFVFGCHAKCSNFDFTSHENSLIPMSKTSVPEEQRRPRPKLKHISKIQIIR
ncbi:hypothetical protein Hanom_Chr05g00458591 [Helianthus anomalus]